MFICRHLLEGMFQKIDDPENNISLVLEPQHFHSTDKRCFFEGDFNRHGSVHQKDNPGDGNFYWGNHRVKGMAVDLFAELGNWLANVSSPYEETSSVRSWVGIH
ncbi:hypothetical protein T265_08107 [Opisthorchis viverrini]|uniref:Uncharacterized protein n=1 Tax=Opisthorchis viverrini TaxID=6198 RepID=A0A075A9K6_OPIVI|nr:hypothetical protein T265_08107 [Opisthorchis viverrini]KER24169.1 hypothetical protein T265_08107 [Opisthorchis viverrini]